MKTIALTGAALVFVLWLFASPASAPAAMPWGSHGHTIASLAASQGLPDAMPGFFIERADQLAYLNPEPDRWRNQDRRAMDEAFESDHYIDLERVPEGLLQREDRWDFLRALYAEGYDRPEDDVGLLPYHILELYERITTGWEQWRRADDAAERGYIEDRIINDAGTLGHYVTDAAQPHHTTIHFNGWDPDAPNPEGYGDDRTFHSRFETAFVQAQVRLSDLTDHMAGRGPRRIGNVRSAVLEHIMQAHELVPELYRLDRDLGFDPERGDPQTHAFAVERLAAGASMLQDLWWTAWVESAG